MSEDPLWPRASQWLSGALPAAAAPGGRLGVVGVPLSRTSISPSGGHETPAAVRAALRRFPTYHRGLDADLTRLDVVDLGDLPVADLTGAEALAEVTAQVGALPARDLLVLLGGDNAVTRPALRALASDLATAGLITLDAHHDVRGFHAGPTNGTPVRGLIEDGLVGSNVVQLGLGNLTNSAAYRRWCDEQGLTTVSAAEVRARGARECMRAALEHLAGCSSIYVDLDVDVLDSSFAPGCPGARPGGLTPGELLACAEEAGLHPAVSAVDIVEVDATADVGGRTVDVAAMCLLSVAAGLVRRDQATASQVVQRDR
ncbi:MAG TPA: agmatinase family protein [Mycobacteriales bacterium]|nr:agmatinase family protein [Mycobacteriales bacterium]